MKEAVIKDVSEIGIVSVYTIDEMGLSNYFYLFSFINKDTSHLLIRLFF